MSQHPGEFAADRPVTVDDASPTLTEPLSTSASRKTLLSPPSPRGTLLAAAGAAALAATGYFGWDYWTVGRFQVSTDDAYIQADNTTIAPKVSGYVAEVLVGDNDPLKSCQTLSRFDDRDFRVALDQAKADVAAASAAIGIKQASIEAQQSAIEYARAAIRVDEANSAFADQDDKRYATLATSGYGSVQNAQAAASRSAASRAAVQRDQAALEAAIQQIGVLKAELAEAQATLARDQAAERQAELNLSYTTIVSPIDGVVGARTLRAGQYTQAGAQLMAVVPVSAAYVVANYKETQLADVRPGQKVEIVVDIVPGRPLSGRVDSIAPASGQEFALLPPDNATGNFTKVVQRIPVKIVLEAGSPLATLLRPGMSVYPTIDTKTPSIQSASISVPRG